MPWKLLAALNVKYVMRVDRPFWFNPPPESGERPFDPEQMVLLENPNPVTPRAFFAATVTPADENMYFPGDNGTRPAPTDPQVDDLTVHSIAEGIGAEQHFSTIGTLAAAFDDDRIVVRVEPSAEPRFLVINEMYHPSWRAWVDGAPSQIYPTNIVMRGVVVPPGATTIELRFAPFLVSGYGIAIMLVGIGLGVLGFFALWRGWLDRPVDTVLTFFSSCYKQVSRHVRRPRVGRVGKPVLAVSAGVVLVVLLFESNFLPTVQYVTPTSPYVPPTLTADQARMAARCHGDSTDAGTARTTDARPR